MSDEAVYTSFLEEQRLALFEYLGEGVFRPIGPPPAFLTAILGVGAANAATLRLGDTMPFLENFVADAEEFWNSNSQGRAESGAWIEKGEDEIERALEAWAVRLAGRKILLIQNPQERYDERARVLQTARDSLLEHQKLLREIQKKEILLHCIVHDLSQPLTAIRGSLSLLKLQSMGPEFKEVLEIAERQSEKQESMIRGILEAFSAELAAQQAMESDASKAPDLARSAQKTVEAFQTAFQERGARISLSPDLDVGRDWRVAGEESRLLRIFGNLVENALRHSPAGSTVTLGASDNGNFALGFVDDEGPGLPEDVDATRLFGLFAKGKGERAGKAGLGLYFCKMTVERWGGTIGCENRPALGARFWFRLPRATKHSERPEPH
jgi:signal transduction histidine kinase